MSGECDHAHQWHRVSIDKWKCAVPKCGAERVESSVATQVQKKRMFTPDK